MSHIDPARETPDHFRGDDFSPYRFFSAEDWARFRADTPLTLTEEEVRRLRSLNDPVDLRQYRLALRRTSLKQLLDPRQTAGNVHTGDASCVERPHC